jgi:hypothetical protein
MLGQDIVGDVQGLIQSRVGTFLQLRTQLQEMSRSPVLTISDKASQLLPTQTQLETDLPDAIARAQTGSLVDLAFAGAFYYQMDKQISDVTDLWNEYKGLGSSAQASLIPGLPNWSLFAIGGLVFLKLAKGKGKRKK